MRRGWLNRKVAALNFCRGVKAPLLKRGALPEKEEKVHVNSVTHLPQTVQSLVDQAAVAAAAHARLNFNSYMETSCQELGMQSPIEQMFWVAIHAVANANFIEVSPSPLTINGSAIFYGLHIKPQVSMGRYRVDFVLTNYDCERPESVVVELDGHAFHDKTKEQRAYEKARDRFMVKSGYKVLHFTGSEVFASPYKVAHECMTVASVPVGDFDLNEILGAE